MNRWLAILLSIFFFGCSKEAPPKKSVFPKPVIIETAIKKDVPITLETFGHVTPINIVHVKSQIDGAITNVLKKDGDRVSVGDSLFEIDVRRYKAELDQAKALLDKNQANLENAKNVLERYEKLIPDFYVSNLDIDQFRTDVHLAKAQIEIDQANLQIASINLDHCTIRSPIEGKLGKIQLSLGNIVKAASQEVLASISQLKPIYVNFALPQKHFSMLHQKIGTNPLMCQAELPNGKIEKGEVFFIDNKIDGKTGTIAFMGLFENFQERLWPGQFVRVSLFLEALPNATVVPIEAIQEGQEGPFVFVIDPEMKAEMRSVKRGKEHDRWVVIEDGVQAGEKVVTQGQMNLSPGTLVSVKNKD